MNEEKLLILLSLAVPEPAEADEARRLGPACDWDELWSLAELNATAPLVHHNAVRLGLAIPDGARRRFEEKSEAIGAANEARLAVARRLFGEFAERGIPVVVLKGILFAETIYRDPYYKKMNDVDILVRKQDLDAVYDIYEKLQFFCAAELVGGSPRKQEKFSHHAPPFFSRDLKCMIGTHWGLITPLAPYTLDYDAIWSRVEDFQFYGLPAKQMAPEDNLHHLCVHLPYYKTGVRELADIYNLIRHYRARLDGALLEREIEKAKTENLVYHALSLAHRICPTPEAAAAIAAVAPRVSAYYRRDTGRKIASLSRLLRARSVHMSRIEKAYSELNATRRPREKWQAFGRIWANLLAPPEADVRRMNSLGDADSDGALWRARLYTPLRIYRVFERDLGGKIFFAMLAKCAYEVVRDTLRAPLAPNAGGEDYQAWADKLGVTVADLEKLKDALE
jgi:hypothetical protein